MFCCFVVSQLGLLMRNWKKTVSSIKFNHEEIIRKSKAMIINEEVLLKLQESYALEMISASEHSAHALQLQQQQQADSISDHSSPPTISSPPPGISGDEESSGRNNSSSNSNNNSSSSRTTTSPAKESWLNRYGHSRIADEAISDMLRVRDDLRNLEMQVLLNSFLLL